MNSIEQQFCEYLKQGEFHEFMALWRKQVERLNHIGGSIKLPITTKNQKDIEGLLGGSYQLQSIVRISWRTVQKSIQQTKFEGCDFEVVLRLYYQEDIISKKTKIERKTQAIQKMFDECVQKNPQGKAAFWIQQNRTTRGVVIQRIQQAYEESPKLLQKEFTWVCEAIDHLPIWEKKKENLAVFSSQITGDPHAFDYGSFPSYIFMQALCELFQLSSTLSSNLDKNEVLVQAGLYKDSVSNYCMLAHIQAIKKDGTFHPGWKGFYDHYEIWNVNIANLTAIEQIDVSTCKHVVVIENPSVFQILAEQAKRFKIEMLGFVCTNGQLNFCGYQLLDMLIAANIQLYYCGDMDPEGLLIADRLKQRYKEQLMLWHYENEDYRKAKSDKFANAKRCKMIMQIKDPVLLRIGKLLETQPIGYQENLIEVYKNDICKDFEKTEE